MTLSAMLATEAALDKLPPLATTDRWVFEQKVDGHRVLAVIGPGHPTFLNRRGDHYGYKVPAAIRRYLTDHRPMVLDGELVNNHYYVFDLLRVGRQDLRHCPLEQRRTALEGLILHDHVRVLPQARTPDQRLWLARKLLEVRGEGVVAKHLDRPYLSGARSPDVLKFKFVHSLDCVLAPLPPGEDRGQRALGLELMDDGQRVPIGAVSMLSKPGKVGDVVEVRYLYATDAPRLYQPRIVRVRKDKLPNECTVDQLSFTSKAILELEGAAAEREAKEVVVP